MNWTPITIFEARDKLVDSKAGPRFVKLYVSGWAIGKEEGLDVWSACYLLNSIDAQIASDEEPRPMDAYRQEMADIRRRNPTLR